MSYVMVDIEADGPIPGDYSMVSLGAVVVEEELNRTFYAKIKPISESWIPEALAVSGFSREETLSFPSAPIVMFEFKSWLSQIERPMFVSDNNGFDWMFVCWYFHHFIGENPFGYSSTNLGSFYKGIVRNVKKNFKHLRKTKHTHNALEDAIGNAEAMMEIFNTYEIHH